METSCARVICKLRNLYPINKDGFITPVHAIMKFIPSLQNGLNFVAFFKEFDKYFCPPYLHIPSKEEEITHYLLYQYDKNNMHIHGIT